MLPVVKTVEHAERKQIRTWNESAIFFKSGNIYFDRLIFVIVNTKLWEIVVPNNDRINRIQHIEIVEDLECKIISKLLF